MKSLTDIVKDFVVSSVVGVAALGGVSAKADILSGAIPISSFKDLISPKGGAQYVQMEFGDNLKVRNSNGVASVVEKDGGVWRMGFVNYVVGGMIFGGYANNDNGYSNNLPGAEGWCFGLFYDSVFDGERVVEDVIVVHDRNGDGIGYFYNGIWYLGNDDDIYFSGDIEFNGIQGDLSQIPIPFSWGTAYLPKMTIDARPVRTGPAGIKDLVALAENWISQDCSPEVNADCNGADWNYDGKVNLVDFSLMAGGWNPGYVSE